MDTTGLVVLLETELEELHAAQVDGSADLVVELELELLEAH